LSLRLDKLFLFLERLLDYDLDAGDCPGNCLADRRARFAANLPGGLLISVAAADAHLLLSEISEIVATTKKIWRR
jgi:hypothetical protein